MRKPRGRFKVVNIKIRLILNNSQDSDLVGKQPRQKINFYFKKLFISRLVFAFLIASIPSSANASVFSFVSSLFNNSVPEKSLSLNNSQNMALLEAPLNPEIDKSIGGGNITIENNALLPEVGPSGSIANISEQASSDKISIYVVRKGDSLSQIAKMFKISVNTIIWANNLRNSVIKEGQTLVILPITGIQHVVKRGETLRSIAKKYKGDLKEILQFNNLSKSSKLKIGDVVIIPDGDIVSYHYKSVKRGKTVFVDHNPYRGGSGPYYPGYYTKPVHGVLTQGLHGYNAVDFGAPIGTPIVASATGRVIISRNYGWNGGYGSYVVLQHNNGTQTLYAHMSKNISYVKEYVLQGQVIGYVGSTGKSTGPHVHFEVRGAKNPFARYR